MHSTFKILQKKIDKMPYRKTETVPQLSSAELQIFQSFIVD